MHLCGVRYGASDRFEVESEEVMSQKIVELPPMTLRAMNAQRQGAFEIPLEEREGQFLALLQSLSDAGIEVVDGKVDPAQFDKCLFCKCTSGTHMWACPRNNAAGKTPAPPTGSAEELAP